MSTAFLVVQEGGSSCEIYIHGSASLGEANEYRRSCSEGSYRTAKPIEVPHTLTHAPDFYDVIEEVARAAVSRESAVVPEALAVLPGFYEVAERVREATLNGLDYLEDD